MNSRDIAFLACRFFAIFIMLQTLYIIASVAPAVFGGQNIAVGGAAIVLSIFLASSICAMLFWFKAEWIASKIMGSHNDQPANTPPHREDLQNAGFAVIGMFVLANVLPHIANSVVLSLLDIEGQKPQIVLYKHMAYNIQLAVELTIGIFLIFGADGISKFIKKLRG